MQIILFENDKVSELHPITLARPAFDILCGGITLFDLIKREFPKANIVWLVRDYLVNVARQKHGRSVIKPDSKVLFLDASLSPGVAEVRALVAKIKLGKNFVWKNHDRAAVAALVDYQSEIKKLKREDVGRFLSKQKVKNSATRWPQFNHLWEVITVNHDILRPNLELIYKDGVSRGRNVTISEHVLLDTKAGPIVLGDNVQIAPFVNLVGPLYIGPNCKVNEFSALKGGVCLGPFCKVGGELDATVIQGYTNKQHQGVLAFSYVGEWVNLGGGTATSDLKNTYGPVKMKGENSGQLFLGCVLGDHSKTAINTAIFTGKVIGVNSTLFGFVARDVPSFTNYLGQLGQNVEFSLEQAIKVQKIVMARRNVKQTKADVGLLREVFRMTQNERSQAKIKKGNLVFNK